MSKRREELIVITCAGGKQASALLPHLTSSAKENEHLSLRLVVQHNTERLQSQYPNAEIISADLREHDTARRILKGASAIFFIEPPFANRQVEMVKEMVEAAKFEAENGLFNHFVYSSVLHPQLSKMLHHSARLSTEEYLIESGLTYTILQPTHFLALPPVGPILAADEPVYEHLWNPDTYFSFLALPDLGEVAAKVLRERKPHFYATYQLSSAGPASYRDVLDMIGEMAKKEVRVETIEFEEAVEIFTTLVFGKNKEWVMEEDQEDAAERMLLYYNRRGLCGNNNVCRWLLGREPMELREMVKRML